MGKYGHRITPLGKFSAKVVRGDKSMEATLTVMKSNRLFGLLGRDLIPQSSIYYIWSGHYKKMREWADPKKDQEGIDESLRNFAQKFVLSYSAKCQWNELLSET